MSRYQRYSGGDPLAPPVDLSEALEAIGEDVMAGWSPERASAEFLRRGPEGRRGLDDLAAMVARRRRDLLREHDLDGTLREVRELLDEAILAERGQLARDVDMDDTDRAFRQVQLDNLPASPASAVTELASYDWASSEARQKFEEIKDLLGREMLDQHFAGMKQALEGATEADREAVVEMLRDLNALLAMHAAGRDVAGAFEEFMERHGHHFPEQPRTIEELLDVLAARSAAAQRMLNSMTPEQRDELMRLSAEAFGSPELAEELARMDASLRVLRPGEDWDSSARFSGEDSLGLGDGTGALQELADLDALGEQLSQSYGGARLDDVDLDAVARLLGEEAAADARTLAELERALRDSEYLRRGTDGDLRLTPQAMRQLGRALLKDAVDRLDGRTGRRDTRRAGAAGELTGATRPWAFGDTEPWDVTRTITNAVLRTASEGADPRRGLRLSTDDIEVAETEARTRAAVVLLVDTSFSMAMDGRWVPMKRTALALHHLVSTRFRGDDLVLVSFGEHARQMDVSELTALEPRWAKGTNLHHGLLLANRHFRRHPGAQPVLLVVTDGEPTAHLQHDGRVWFSYPPHPSTLAHTVKELDATRRLGARTTFFRLGDDPGLARFVDAMAARVDGRVVAPELDDLGAAVVGSYLGGRRAGRPGGSSGRGGPEDGGWGFGSRGAWVP